MKMSQHANKMLARQKKLYEHSKDSMNTHLGMGFTLLLQSKSFVTISRKKKDKKQKTRIKGTQENAGQINKGDCTRQNVKRSYHDQVSRFLGPITWTKGTILTFTTWTPNHVCLFGMINISAHKKMFDCKGMHTLSVHNNANRKIRSKGKCTSQSEDTFWPAIWNKHPSLPIHIIEFSFQKLLTCKVSKKKLVIRASYP